MTQPANPRNIFITRNSEQNGIITTLNLTIVPTNTIQNGDIITFTLPYPVTFS